MADLSDADKKILLGAGYKQDAARLDAERGITDATRSAKARAETINNLIMVSSGAAFLAFLIGIANFYSRGTPYNATLVTVCSIIFIGSMACIVWLKRSQKQSQ
jgi:hypothetical protein